MRLPEIHPARIAGKWRQGYVLDYHTVSSEFMGYDEFDHPRFHTVRTELGELLYRLKYCSDRTALEPIVHVVTKFLRTWKPQVDSVVPTPPSRTRRLFQPVVEICKSVCQRLELALITRALTKTTQTPEIKEKHDRKEKSRLLAGAFAANANVLKERSILLIDDLYDSSSTLNAITQTLYSQGKVAAVFVLVLTRTRSLP